MKKLIFLLTAILLAAFILAGCGASMNVEESVDMEPGYEYSDSSAQSDSYKAGSMPVPAPMEDESKYYDNSGGVYEEGRKAIKTADVEIEVDNFQRAYDTIKSMLGSNGYIEESNIWKTPSYYNGEQIMLTNGTIRLRIKADSFIGFTEGLSGIGTVLSARTYEDDISDMYYDTEARLQLLEDEKDRLEQYADDVEDPDIFFQTQSRITQVIYEMESLQGSLKKWDSKVEYSTVSIAINEIHPDEESVIVKPKGFFEKIWENMKDSFSFLGDVAIFLFGILPVLLILGAVVTVIIIVVKKLSKKDKPPVNKEKE